MPKGMHRNRSAEWQPFRLIPRGTVVPVVVHSVRGRVVDIKHGNNAGRQSQIYGFAFYILTGEFRGQRIFDDFWCQADIPAGTTEVDSWGDSRLWCEYLEATKAVVEKDGEITYPFATTEAEVEKMAAQQTGQLIMVTVGSRVKKWKDMKTQEMKEREGNTVTSIIALTDEQKSDPLLGEGVAMWRAFKVKEDAKKSGAKAGTSGMEDLLDGDDDDLPF